MIWSSFIVVFVGLIDITVAHDDERVYFDVGFSSIYCQNLNGSETLELKCDFQGNLARLVKFHDDLFDQNVSSFHLSLENVSLLWVTQEFLTSWRQTISSMRMTFRHVNNITLDSVEQTSLGQSESFAAKFENCSMDALSPGLISNTNILELEINKCHIDRIASNAFQKVGRFTQLRIVNSTINQWQNDATPAFIVASESPQPTEMLSFLISGSSITKLGTNALSLKLDTEVYFNIVNVSVVSISSGALKLIGSGHVIITDSTFHDVEDSGIEVNLLSPKNSSLRLFEKPTFTSIGSFFNALSINQFFQNIRVTNGPRYFIRTSLNSTKLRDLAQVADLWTVDNRLATIEDMAVICSCEDLETLNSQKHDISNYSVSSTPTPDPEYAAEDYPAAEAEGPSTKRLETAVRCFHNVESLLNFSAFYQLHCVVTTAESTMDTGNQLDITSEPAPSYIFDHWLFYLLTAGGVAGVVSLILLGTFHVARRRRSTQINQNDSRNHATMLGEEHVIGVLRTANKYQSAVGMASDQPIYGDHDDEC